MGRKVKTRSWTGPVFVLCLILPAFCTLGFLYAAENNRTYLPIINKPTGFFEGPQEVEPNNSFGEANGPLRTGKNYTGYPNDANDLYSFIVTKTGKITVDVQNHQVEGGQARLYREVGGRPEPIGDLAYIPPNYHIEVPDAQPGKYYFFVFVDINKQHSVNVPYSLKIIFPGDVSPTTTPKAGSTPTATIQPGTTPTATPEPGVSPTPTATSAVQPSPTATRAEGTLQFGEAVSGTIANSLETKEFSFSAAAGDKVLARLAISSGDLDPQFSIRRPNGSELCSEASYSLSIEKVCVIDTNGLHKIIITDYGSDNTGSFSLYIQRLNNPISGVPITYHEHQSATIYLPAFYSTFTFNPTGGDKVLIQMHGTSSGFNPRFIVYDSTGTLVCTVSSYSPTIEKLCFINSGGQHTILAGEYGADISGSFDLYIQSTNNPGSGLPIAYDETKSATIFPSVAFGTFTLNPSVGDKVLIRMHGTTDGFDPRFILYDSNGTEICTDASYSPTIEKLCFVNGGGLHTILAGEYGGEMSGSFDLYIQSTNNPANALPIPYNEVKSSTIFPSVDLSPFSFDPTAGDKILVRMHATTSGFDPRFIVYDSSGTEICTQASYSDSIEKECDIFLSGRHTILAGEYGGDMSGSFDLVIQRTNNAVNAEQ